IRLWLAGDGSIETYRLWIRYGADQRVTRVSLASEILPEKSLKEESPNQHLRVAEQGKSGGE
ncbi:MAG: hypothetical protein ABI222_17050, partial [Opitutaceae bacterium]